MTVRRDDIYGSKDEIGLIHAPRTSGDFAALPHALQLSATLGIFLALHVVVIIGSTARSNEVCRTHKRSGASANLLDLWNAVGKGREVV
jgi:hypothetical protein